MKTILALTAASVLATAALLASQPDPMQTGAIGKPAPKGGRSQAQQIEMKPGFPLDRY